MTKTKIPFYNRILIKLLLPVIVVSLLCATFLVSWLSLPLEKYILDKFDKNMEFVSSIGLEHCENSFSYLLDLRLEKSKEMNQSMQNEVIGKFKKINKRFPGIHFLVIEGKNRVRTASLDTISDINMEKLTSHGRSNSVFSEIGGKKIRANIRFFPFWNWHLVFFVFEDEYKKPVSIVYKITYMSASVVFITVLLTLLLAFFLLISKPLNKLTIAAEKVSEGELKKIEDIDNNEFGRLIRTFNIMVGNLIKEKTEVSTLISRLEESEALFRSQFEFGSIGIAITEVDGTWIRANNRLCEILGYSEDELSRLPIEKIFESSFFKSNRKHFTGMLRNTTDSYEDDVKMFHKNGSAIDCHISISCVRKSGGRVKYLIASILDISERKEMENQVRQLRNYLSNIIDSMPSVLIGVDRNGVITQWNNSAEKKTGISRSKAEGSELSKIYKELSGELSNIEDSISERKVKSSLRQSKSDDGEIKYDDITIYPLTANGVEGAVIRVDDVTEKMMIEEMMIQSEKMLSVGGLAAGMAHEINNPLAGMIQTGNVMKSRLSDLSIPANLKAAEKIGISLEGIKEFMELRGILRMIDAINDSGKQVSEIVNNMLSFSRKTDANASSHDPYELVDKVLNIASTDYDLKKKYDFKAIEIEKEYEKDLPLVQCEGTKIQQVLLNILRNGAQAMEGAIDNPKFVIRLIKNDKKLRIEIEDNGSGMSESVRKRVFEPFFTTKPPGSGTGLGLSVSYFIITENHGGFMDVESKLGKGTRFIIELPFESVGGKIAV